MNNNFSILVNTTDFFEDCWSPFFKLFNKYWPDYEGEIYLNTETKTFDFPGLNIVPIQNVLEGKTWSQCLKHALEFIDEEYILYIQEDYFLHSIVNNALVKDIFKKFKENNLDCLHLTDQCTNGPFNKNTGIDGVWEIEKGAEYRLSTQAAFWKKESLLKLIRTWESGWQFEEYGTKRAWFYNNKFFIIDTKIYGVGKKEIIPYIFTGIIKSKWNKSVVPLFKKHDIKIDYTRRGFYNPTTHSTLFERIKNRLMAIYIKIHLLSTVDLFFLKIKAHFKYGH